MIFSLPVSSFNPTDYDRGEPGIHGIVDLIKWEVWKWDGARISRLPLPKTDAELRASSSFPESHKLVDHLVYARTMLLDSLFLRSEELLNSFSNSSANFSYLDFPPSVLLPQIRHLVLKNDIVPVLCGSAFKHIGTELLLDYVGHLLPSPSDGLQKSASQSRTVQLLAWKVMWDQRKGWMTFVRVYAGESTVASCNSLN